MRDFKTIEEVHSHFEKVEPILCFIYPKEVDYLLEEATWLEALMITIEPLAVPHGWDITLRCQITDERILKRRGGEIPFQVVYHGIAYIRTAIQAKEEENRQAI